MRADNRASQAMRRLKARLARVRRPTVPLAEFLSANADSILSEWDAFADRTSSKGRAAGIDQAGLRGAGDAVFKAIIDSVDAEAHGFGEHDASNAIVESVHAHAGERLAHGFTLDQMVAEYRALRISVIRRCGERAGLSVGTFAELDRFHDAVDRASTETIKWFYERVERARDLLVAVLAHDVRAPLGVILASADHLLEAGRLEGQNRAGVVRVRQSALRLRSLANDLLDFSRSRLGNPLPYKPTEMDLEQVCRTSVEELRSLYPEAELRLECSGDLTGRWDASRIEQMLSNLIGNAIEHGEAHSPITITADGRAADAVAIVVRNLGPPVPLEVQQVMLDPLRPFPSLKPEHGRRTRGLGLGLFIARQIAEAHGGSVELVSREGEGTSINVRLPRRSAC